MATVITSQTYAPCNNSILDQVLLSVKSKGVSCHASLSGHSINARLIHLKIVVIELVPADLELSLLRLSFICISGGRGVLKYSYDFY